MRIYHILGDLIGIGVAYFKTAHGSWIFWINPTNAWDFTMVLWVKVGFKAKKPWLTWMGINGGVMIFIRNFVG